MKATEQYFPVVLYIVWYTVVLSFESADEILECNRSIKFKVIEHSGDAVRF